MSTLRDVSHLIDAKSVMAFAVILQHEVRKPLGRGWFAPSGHVFLTLSDHGREDRQSFESAVKQWKIPRENATHVANIVVQYSMLGRSWISRRAVSCMWLCLYN